MIDRYVKAAIEEARYKQLDNSTWFAEIPGFEGVWANGKSVEICRQELIEVLEEWIILKVRSGDSLPVVHDVDINIKEISAA